jgi:pimeloyl-ACP methyl ester carboxylesterase
MSDAITPFRIETPEAELEALRARIRATRWPEKETPDDWSQGIPLAYVRELAQYWAERYDWRATEARLNALPQFTTPLDGLDIHFLHVRSPVTNARPLVLTHGWPGSIVEFLKVIGPLTDPLAHGGSAADAFHVVCPSLPGFGWSGKPTRPGWGIAKIATEWDTLMRRLGYDAYFAQGGDWGAIVTTAIGSQNLGHCRGIHANMAIALPDPATMNDLTDFEKSALAGMQHYQDSESGYSKQQSTRPQTIGYALVDSPVGQLAWIVEKFWAWTDCNGHPENVLTRDELLDNVMTYWLPAAGASSARIYWESFASLNRDPVPVPSGISVFPKEIFRTSRRWAEQRYTDLRFYQQHERGGHFAAFEVPEQFVVDVRAAFAAMSLDG